MDMTDTPLTKEKISSLIADSPCRDKIEDLMKNFFVGLDKPCSVSLGCD